MRLEDSVHESDLQMQTDLNDNNAGRSSTEQDNQTVEFTRGAQRAAEEAKELERVQLAAKEAAEVKHEKKRERALVLNKQMNKAHAEVGLLKLMVAAKAQELDAKNTSSVKEPTNAQKFNLDRLQGDHSKLVAELKKQRKLYKSSKKELKVLLDEIIPDKRE